MDGWGRRSLPKWIRRDIIRGSREHWIYSGMEEIGWSMISIGGIGWVGQADRDNLEDRENLDETTITQRVIQPPPTAIAPAMMSGGGADLCTTGASGAIQTQFLIRIVLYLPHMICFHHIL